MSDGTRSLGMFGEALPRHRAFWEGQPTDRPLLTCAVGIFMDDKYPLTSGVLPGGLVSPDDIKVDLFLEDCERQYLLHKEVGDDSPFVASALKFVPWMEAIMGCPIMTSPSSMWAEPCIADWDTWSFQGPALENPWARKLLELLEAVAEHAAGRYPVSCTLMRGPFDMLSAMRGPAELPLDLYDRPDTVMKTAQLCADVFIEMARAQHAIIPDCADGYMDGDRGFRYWAPDKPIWVQEDALSLLSPTLCQDYVIPVDRRIAREFGAVAYHLHGVAVWSVKDLVEVPEVDVIEIDFDDARSEAEVDRTFDACRMIQSKKRLVAFKSYDDRFFPWLERALIELSHDRLSIQTAVPDVETGKQILSVFKEKIAKF